MTLKEGEKWMKMVVTVGDVDFTFSAFPNKDRTEENKQPHYKGKNIGVWVNTKKAEDKPKEEAVL
jgi:hypothetical protein|tara:strand:- start:578 stop:772 length:195 start_codon:yes stop_codon:yes gene_type:complete